MGINLGLTLKSPLINLFSGPQGRILECFSSLVLALTPVEGTQVLQGCRHRWAESFFAKLTSLNICEKMLD